MDLLATRHGLTFEAWKLLAETAEWRHPAARARFVKPLTFMNLSGNAVVDLMAFYKVDLADLLVVCDDVNLPEGRLRIRSEGSEGGNNGLRSISASLGTTVYARLRIGVGRGDTRRDLADHVLSRFGPDEQPVINGAIERAADAVEVWMTDGLAPVMNRFNRPEDTK